MADGNAASVGAQLLNRRYLLPSWTHSNGAKKDAPPPGPSQTPTPLQDGCESHVLAGAPGSSSEGRGEGPLTRGQPLRSLRAGLGHGTTVQRPWWSRRMSGTIWLTVK